MDWSLKSITLLAFLVVVVLLKLAKPLIRHNDRFNTYLTFTSLFFVCFVISDLIKFAVGIWVLAILSFLSLREYFTLIDIRLQDRLGILGAYLSVPFMFYFIQTDWYGMFIISIPVYSFLAIPLLVTFGGKETEGTVLSIGAIDFGLFLFVFCLGHIGYLISYNVWMPVMMIVNVLICDLLIILIKRKKYGFWKSIIIRFLLPAPLTVTVALLLSSWSDIPMTHSVILGLMIPILVMMGQHMSRYVEEDLGIDMEKLKPGRGQILNNIKSLFFTAPVIFHYIRYFLIE